MGSRTPRTAARTCPGRAAFASQRETTHGFDPFGKTDTAVPAGGTAVIDTKRSSFEPFTVVESETGHAACAARVRGDLSGIQLKKSGTTTLALPRILPRQRQHPHDNAPERLQGLLPSSATGRFMEPVSV
jgi:hypothetical protein